MNLSLPSQANPGSSSLFASVDMGTNSFKLLIADSDPSGRFFTKEQIKEPVVLTGSSNPISPQSQLGALQSLHKFKRLILDHNVPSDQVRCVATAGIREAENKLQFVKSVYEDVGFDVDILSGEEEATLAYLGVLQFLPILDKSALCVDIGGGSTEFVVGKNGEVKFAKSLKLGHLKLTQEFVETGLGLLKMREHIKLVIEESGLVDKVKECGGFEVAVGSSGTVRAIQKAVSHHYCRDFAESYELCLEECKGDWKISRGELNGIVERLCYEGDEEKIKRDRFFKRRSESIVAGSILLEEIFEALGAKEMEVSDYAVGEGVIADTLSKTSSAYDCRANAVWKSVVRLATRFNGKKRMKSAVQCAEIAKEIFKGLQKFAEHELSMDNKDLEYLEAACLLHNIGIATGKKGYHKSSYRIITNGDHVLGYSPEEVKLIALLTRHHRKKFPKLDGDAFDGFLGEVKRRFRILCLIIRLAVILQQSGFQEVEFSRSGECFELLLKEQREQPLWAGVQEPLTKDIETRARQELELFQKELEKRLIVTTSMKYDTLN